VSDDAEQARSLFPIDVHESDPGAGEPAGSDHGTVAPRKPACRPIQAFRSHGEKPRLGAFVGGECGECGCGG
jgi:hypothetical protein